MGVDDDFGKIIENRIKIPASQQNDGLVVKEEMLFQLAIDFCKYYEKSLKSMEITMQSKGQELMPLNGLKI
ncbi:MAG: hypothetical protein P0S93_02830 [Candidatus Neptunochlamydia sp.]|nr:hypothetical protein [Candidatus Neptunochlamydia sp.]